MPDSKLAQLKATILGSVVAAAVLISAAPASATPVADNDASYAALGRVFPDPLATCSFGGPEPCSPNAQGNVPATQFIQFGEFERALEYMNTNAEWQNYMEVWPLATGEFPGNNLGRLEFTPDPAFKSAGLPTSDLGRKKSDLYVVRVTDESVPDAGKKRYTLSLSIHGIERAGAEGGTRAMEDLVTAFTEDRDGEIKADDLIVPESVDPDAPTFEEVLKKSIVYFTYPNPDGWIRGSATNAVDPDGETADGGLIPGMGGGGFFFQRYNGNGVDPNRDWPDIGYSFRPYSGASEPETRAFERFYADARKTGGQFDAGDDLHGQPFADALSYTLLPHGRHDWAKNQRIRHAAETIHHASEAALLWSPIIQGNDEPRGGAGGCVETPLGAACQQMYGQTWGTVYDTIDYTTTGTLGDWFDSRAGLNADGIDNEMSFSHLDRNIIFDPHGEQLHVDGNKALIYAHLNSLLNPPEEENKFEAQGRKGYVPNSRIRRTEKVNQPEDSGQEPQAGIEMGPKPQGGCTSPDDDLSKCERTVYDAEDGFVVEPGNGGMRVQVTAANLQGIGATYPVVDQIRLRVECKCVDEHMHAHEGHPDRNEPEWTVVAEDYNQAQAYLASGLVATVNNPQAIANGEPVPWRIVIEGDNTIFNPDSAIGNQPSFYGATKATVDFTSGPASADGNTGGDEPPKLAAYDVANTDFFRDLNEFAEPDEKFGEVDPAGVIAGTQDLSELDTLVLADGALPGYTGRFGSGQVPPAHAPIQIASEQPTFPAAHQPDADREFNEPGARVPGSYEVVNWEVGGPPAEANKSMKIEIDAASGDYDIYLYRVDAEGNETYITDSASDGAHETITVGSPKPGAYRLYVDNWLAPPDAPWSGSITFEAYPSEEDGGGDTGAYTAAEKDQWTAKLRDFVTEGGNLVLTDSSLMALPDLVSGISRLDVAKQTVYVGQVAFSNDGEDRTSDDPLAEGIDRPGARYGSGGRRQMFEPTPLGFAIQAPNGDDMSAAPQYDVDRGAWEAAGGRYVAGSADSGTRNAQAVHDRVTIGEIEIGKGQIRIAGSLLPQPSQEYDHPLGIEPYAVTYTGYEIARNLVDWRNPDRPDDPDPDPDPDGDDDDTAGSNQPPATTPKAKGKGKPKAKRKCKKAKKKKAKRKKCKRKKKKKKKK